jgi:vacuolar-type H+-ATPase subunit H
MASQIISGILSVEKTCDSRLSDAEKQAEWILEDAKAKADEIMQNAETQAKEIHLSGASDAETEAKRLQAESDAKSSEDVRALKDTVRRRSGAATDAVIELLLNSVRGGN